MIPRNWPEGEHRNRLIQEAQDRMTATFAPPYFCHGTWWYHARDPDYSDEPYGPFATESAAWDDMRDRSA